MAKKEPILDKESLVTAIRGDPRLARVASSIEKLIQPAIRVQTKGLKNESDLPVGASKIGGDPDLPNDVEWPEIGGKPGVFIAQFNLSEISALDPEKVLPTNGVLSFFANVMERLEGYESGGRVLYLDTDTGALARRENPAGQKSDSRSFWRRLKESFSGKVDFARIDEYAVELSGGCSLPVLESVYTEELDFRPGEDDAYSELGERMDEWDCRLLGYPYYVQNDFLVAAEAMRRGIEEAQIWDLPEDQQKDINGRSKDYRLLFQYTEADMPSLFGDMGTLYFALSAENLKVRQFKNIIFDWQFD